MATCVRSRCSNPATAGLAIDSPNREAWLVDWPDDPVLISPLCGEHAATLTVPAGWLIHDNRDATGAALFADRSVAEAPQRATVTRLDHRRARKQTKTESPRLFEPASESLTNKSNGTTADQPDSNVGSDWIGDPDERSSELLEVDGTTPLLARAFRSSQAS